MTENEVSRVIVDAAIEVHRSLGGPGLIESIYEEALAWELSERQLAVQRQVAIPIQYKSIELAAPLRIDLLVNDIVIVECKSTPRYSSIHEAQALTYLRLRRLRLALVINFGQRLVKDGIRRVVNQLAR